MLKKIYRFTIFPYTLFLLYLMFFGMGRYQYDVNAIRIEPIFSTLKYIENTIRWWDIVRVVLGNVVMFVPFGFLGWVFPKLLGFQKLIFTFISGIVIVEGLQYFSRLGIFEVDDVILNTFGVCIGYLLRNFFETRFFMLKE